MTAARNLKSVGILNSVGNLKSVGILKSLLIAAALSCAAAHAAAASSALEEGMNAASFKVSDLRCKVVSGQIRCTFGG